MAGLLSTVATGLNHSRRVIPGDSARGYYQPSPQDFFEKHF
jgi:hypothetical protein